MKKQIGNNTIFNPDNFAELQTRARLKLVEEKVLRKEKETKATEAQRFLIYFHLGLVSSILQLPIAQNKKDSLVSVMLNINQDNARKYLSEVGKKNKPLLQTQANYTFLTSFFAQLGFEEKAKETDKIRLRILSTKK